ncbi:MAG TPA: NAD-glutamate dehydrogenase [Sedimenticola sp.]|nr:NAD-glutamate dehydrogenase [Sedimenticola sp.]
MTTNHAREKDATIARLVAMLRSRLPEQEAGPAVRFARRYYVRSAPEDVLGVPIDDLYGALLSHWRLASHRKAGRPLIRVYNPDFEEHGWQSTHTVIEVVADDMPFLVDSLSMNLMRQGIVIHFTLHPVMRVRRSAAGRLLDVLPPGEDARDAIDEAFMRFEVDRQSGAEVLAGLHASFAGTLEDVRMVVGDWEDMQARMQEAIDALAARKLPVPQDEKEEALAFLRWVKDHHFTFIGFHACDLVEEGGQDVLRLVPASGLGILRGPHDGRISQGFAQIPPPLRSSTRAPGLLVITKFTAQSPVHRPAHMDYLGIRRFNEAGEVVGEWRFLGLFSSTAYNSSPDDIPILRRKVARVMERAALAPNSHAGKSMQNILANFPRDEMFQASDEELLEITTGILHVQERHRLRLFLRRDPFGRFVSAFVYVPRERYNTELRLRMQDILMQELEGQDVEFAVQFSESALARVYFIIHTRPERIPDFDPPELEARLIEAMQSWEDGLQAALLEKFGEGTGVRMAHKYGGAFPAAYREDFSPRTAVLDIGHLEAVSDAIPLDTQLYRPLEGSGELLRFKVYGRRRPMPLSDVLPILERMGLRVLEARPYEIEPAEGDRRWILDFDMTAGAGIEIEVLRVKKIFQEAFARVCAGEIENDAFNRLVLAAGLGWRKVMLLRVICKYLLQGRAPFSQSYMASALANNPRIASLLTQLFLARFDPRHREDREEACGKLETRILEALDEVTSLDEDRILRRYLAVILAMLRTNYFQRAQSGGAKEYLAFKLDPAKVPDLPQPLPMYEIFVYAPWVEGVHLRGGPVARGGLRWSDRREDFRTEILGLMKAQMVKNAVIVPVGAKGGFIAKRLPCPENRDAVQKEVVRCYRTFVSGLLDLTDNLADGEVIPPPRVVRYDGDDPYLVVAADKGTASFSDIANEIAAEYNFWLGDGFASGGSSGYDHKKMGITARGAWESVKRHFRELGVDCQREDFTVIGIGDMSGDVFGNGMLLSRHIRLVGAFNHQHIFIDPNPDAETSYQERERLFRLPRSAWSDYDKKLISKGGGVYSRSAKSISLSPEARQALGIEARRLTPAELIQALLRAPADLLWNGGIGTYVKAARETHADVGDRPNDALRVNARELRVRVVGEGGNLGFTQLARVEYARNGGQINTDAIDNSGGVDCSDHEVNIKILLNQMVRAGDMTLKQRNRLLGKMDSDVADLVLRHNYLQTQAVSISTSQATVLPSEHGRLIQELEREGRLKRKLEFLPSDAELAERQKAGEGLTRPEIAVLLSYSKIKLFEDLRDSDISDDDYFTRELIDYFPGAMREGFTDRMQNHPLRREIIATQITNGLVNRMGSTFILRMQDETGENAAEIARAYTAAREIFQAPRLWHAVEELNGQIAAETQIAMLIEIRRLQDRATIWLLRNRRSPLDITATVNQFIQKVDTVITRIPRLLKDSSREAYKLAIRRYNRAGAPKDLAQRIAILEAAYPALDLVEIAAEMDIPVEEVTDVYFKLGFALNLFWLRDRVEELPRDNYWQRKARMALRYDLYVELRTLSKELLTQARHIRGSGPKVTHWLEQNSVAVNHCRSLLAEIRSNSSYDLAMLSVAIRDIRSLIRHGLGEHINP